MLEHLSCGFRGRCPQCATGRIFKSGITIADECPSCGLKLSEHDTGDGPQVGAIFILGAVVLTVALVLELNIRPPMWVHMAVATPIVFIGSFLVLRPLKGMLVALQYRYRSVDKVDKNLGQM